MRTLCGRLWRRCSPRSARAGLSRRGRRRLAARSPGPKPAEAVDELANGLLALGIGKGDAFGILATRGSNGRCSTSRSRRSAPWRRRSIRRARLPSACYILEHSNAVGCLVESEADLAKIEAARPEHVLHGRDARRACGRSGASTPPATPARSIERRAQIGEDDLFTFIYTSGTTGPPKACMILNRNYYEMVGMIDRSRTSSSRAT